MQALATNGSITKSHSPATMPRRPRGEELVSTGSRLPTIADHDERLAADRLDGVDADDHVHAGVVAELQPDLSPVDELRDEAALA